MNRLDEEKLTKDIQDIQSMISGNLQISRVPRKTLTEFRDLAKNEFCSDYGFCLKYLIDFHNGFFTANNDTLKLRIELLEQRLDDIETVKPTEPVKEEKVKSIRFTNGRVIEQKGE